MTTQVYSSPSRILSPGTGAENLSPLEAWPADSGAGDLDAFWQLLVKDGNAVTEGVPGSGIGRLDEIIRDPSVQYKACRFGAFIDDLDQFDASFFRVSPVEAE